jgi:hypothetical protein
MGGFEGGDEAGFWDEIPESQAEKYRDTLPQRSVLVDSHTQITFVATPCQAFTVSFNGQDLKTPNPLQKAYQLMYEQSDDEDLIDFFQEHKVEISTDRSSLEMLNDEKLFMSFITLTNERCELFLSKQEIDAITTKVTDEVDR